MLWIEEIVYGVAIGASPFLVLLWGASWNGGRKE